MEENTKETFKKKEEEKTKVLKISRSISDQKNKHENFVLGEHIDSAKCFQNSTYCIIIMSKSSIYTI